jgi:hypothetical protein
MALVDVRRLAAIDMHGTAGTRLRRRLIVTEFAVGAAAGLALGLFMVAAASSGPGRLLGAWISGIGVNYIALALQAASLLRPGALDAELAGADIGSDLRRYSYLQVWIFVPLLVAVLAIGQTRRREA